MFQEHTKKYKTGGRLDILIHFFPVKIVREIKSRNKVEIREELAWESDYLLPQTMRY